MRDVIRHRPYQHTAENSDTVVLFVHGILGTPAHFHFLLPFVPDSFSYESVLLEGHGGSVTDFANASMDQWKNQIAKKVLSLKERYDRILIVTHSMGALFAIEEAVNHSDAVAGLFLLSPPLKIRPTIKMFINVLKIYLNCYSEKEYDVVATANACSIQNDPAFWRYIGWLPRYFELFSESKRVRGRVSCLTVPCIIISAAKDEMVGKGTVRYFENKAHIRIVTLENSMHDYYPGEDEALIKKTFEDFLKSYL